MRALRMAGVVAAGLMAAACATPQPVIEQTTRGPIAQEIQIARSFAANGRDMGWDEKRHYDEQLEEKVFNLSGGERQRVAIARALMQHPRLLLADEFISQLDPVTTVSIMDSMKEIVRSGVTLLMTTHELDVVARYAHRVAVLRDGEKVLDCPAAEVTPRLFSEVIKV